MKTRLPIRTALLVILGCAFASISCSRQPPTSPESAASLRAGAISTLHASATALPPAAGTLEGDIGPGAHYVISVPESWNGDLILYAHGYTAPIFPVGIPPGEEPLVEGLRQIALQGGFAFAYSSYSQTGLGLKDATQRTEQLSNLFISLVSRPRRTFLIGASFGALAAVKLVEDHPERYAGLLTLCGMIGGVRAEIDYAAHIRVLFDYFYPGVLPGNLYELPDNLDLQNDIIAPATAAMVANPGPAAALSQVAQVPIPFSNGVELVQSIVQALVLQAVELEDLMTRTHGQGFFDNSQTVYTGNLPPEVLADLNARVDRYTAGVAATRFLDKYYEPTGDLRVPMVSLHTSLDPVVPLFHETVYQARVQAAGQSTNLHQTVIARYGHLLFTPGELIAGFGQLIASAQVP